MKQKKKINHKQEISQKKIEFQKISSFLDKYMSDGQLIVKYATLFDLQRISYIKGKDLKKFFNDNFTEIQKEMLEITKINIGKEPNKDSLQKFYSINQQYDILHYLKRIPGDKAKYPKKLLPLTNEDDSNLDLIFDETGFYLFNISVEKSNKPVVYLILVIITLLVI